ncbi:AAA family ATPase [Candidatus Woesearchaeota archaeon]|nr:AAA family ATPase [Candidatus Woesearchaeota archaeon]
MIIGLTGTLAAGKGTVAEYLIGKGFQYYSLSDELRLLLREKGISPTRDNLTKAGNELRRKYGPAFLAELAIKRLRGAPSVASAVVDSIRNTGEINALRELKDFYLVSVDAPVDIRYERARKRGSERDPKSFSEFLVQEKREMAGKDTDQQLAACIAAADFTILNDGDYKKLYKEIESVLGQIKVKAAVTAAAAAKK